MIPGNCAASKYLYGIQKRIPGRALARSKMKRTHGAIAQLGERYPIQVVQRFERYLSKVLLASHCISSIDIKPKDKCVALQWSLVN